MKTKTVKSLLKRVTTRRMFPSDCNRLAYMQQYNRLKFSESAPPREYLDATQTVENLIPSEMREDNYGKYDLSSRPSYDFVGETITSLLAVTIRKTMLVSTNANVKLTEILDLNLYEPTDLSDVSSADSAESPAQQVPDQDEPYAKKLRKVNQSDPV